MIRLRYRGGRSPALVMLTVLLVMVASAVPAGAQVLNPATLLPPGSLSAEVPLLPGADLVTCDSQAAGQNRYDYVSCVARDALDQVAEGRLTITQGQALIRRAMVIAIGPVGTPLLTRSRP